MSNLIASDMMASFAQECVLLEKTRGPDGQGGSTTMWREGMKFTAYFEDEVNTEANIAGQQGYKATHRVYVNRNMQLGTDDVFKRGSDGRKYRVNRETPDKKTPTTSAMRLRLILCEDWEMPVNASDI